MIAKFLQSNFSNLFKYFIAWNLQMALPQVTKLNSLLLTISTASVSVKQSFPALKKVHNETHKSLTKLSLLITENKILKGSENSLNFSNSATDVFTERNCCRNLSTRRNKKQVISVNANYSFLTLYFLPLLLIFCSILHSCLVWCTYSIADIFTTFSCLGIWLTLLKNSHSTIILVYVTNKFLMIQAFRINLCSYKYNTCYISVYLI